MLKRFQEWVSSIGALFECWSIFWFHPAFYDVWTLAKTKKEEIQPTNFCCSSMFILHSFIVTCFMTNALKLTGQNKQIAKHAFISSVAFSIVNDTTRNPWWLVLPAQFVGLLRKKYGKGSETSLVYLIPWLLRSQLMKCLHSVSLSNPGRLLLVTLGRQCFRVLYPIKAFGVMLCSD